MYQSAVVIKDFGFFGPFGKRRKAGSEFKRGNTEIGDKKIGPTPPIYWYLFWWPFLLLNIIIGAPDAIGNRLLVEDHIRMFKRTFILR